jgi:hypothetical protein
MKNKIKKKVDSLKAINSLIFEKYNVAIVLYNKIKL